MRVNTTGLRSLGTGLSNGDSKYEFNGLKLTTKGTILSKIIDEDKLIIGKTILVYSWGKTLHSYVTLIKWEKYEGPEKGYTHRLYFRKF